MVWIINGMISSHGSIYSINIELDFLSSGDVIISIWKCKEDFEILNRIILIESNVCNIGLFQKISIHVCTIQWMALWNSKGKRGFL